MKPCPFCGCSGTEHVIERMITPRRELQIAVVCVSCGARGPMVDADHEHRDTTRTLAFVTRADKSWNTRKD